MINGEDNLDQQDLAREALSWVFRLRSGDMTTEDAAELIQWRSQGPQHARALSDAVRLRRRLVEAGRAIADPAAAPGVMPLPTHEPSLRSPARSA